MSKKSFIDSVEVKEPCPENWNKMHGTEKVRFCSHCTKHVTNLTEMTRKEALRFVQASDGRICIRYIPNPVTRRPLFADQLLQITRRTAGLAAGIMTASIGLSSISYAQSEPSNTPLPDVVVEKQVDVPLLSNETETTADDEKLGVIQGTIRDYNGQPVAGVTVFLNTAGESHYAATDAVTDENGLYRFSKLDPDGYMLRVVSSSGKWKKVSPGLTLSAGQTIVQDLNVRVVHKAVSIDSIVNVIRGEGFGGAMAMMQYSLPLSDAVARHDMETVKQLLETGTKPNARDKNYEDITPLFIAVENGDIAITRLLLQYGANPNAADKTRRTPLMFVDSDATPELITLLLQAGAKVNVHDKSGESPLFAAVKSGKAEIVQALIDAGADIDATDENSVTALMKAVDDDQLLIVNALITFGADVNARDKSGESVWDKTSDPKIEKALVNAGARADYDVEIEINDKTDDK